MLCRGFCKAPRLTQLRRTMLACVMLLVGLLFAGSVLAVSGCPEGMEGEGTQSSPCQITDRTQLEAINDELGLYYLLMNDIDLDGEPWTPLNTFTGTFDGGGNTISNLTFTASTNGGGLFAETGGATISNLNLTAVVIDGGGNDDIGALIGEADNTDIDNVSATGTIVNAQDYVGGLVGSFENGEISNSFATVNVSSTGESAGGLAGFVGDATISNSHAEGEVNSDDGPAGGLVGVAFNTTITNSYATGNVNVGGWAGGLVGVADDVTITDSYAEGDVDGRDGVGGLVGYADDGVTMTQSHATGDVDGRDYVGGLIGWAGHVDITNSYATGDVDGEEYVGGLVGRTGNDTTITESYATGDVTGDSVGGLVARNSGEIQQSYSTGSVTGNNSGGLVYDNTGTVENSFWDKETSGLTGSDGGTGKTTAELTTFSTFDNAGWSIIEGWQPPNNPVWGICEGANNNYPFLLWQFDENPCATPPPSEPVPVPVNHPLFLLLLGLLTFGLAGRQLRRRLVNQA